MEKIIINQKAYFSSLEMVEEFIEKTYDYKDRMIVLPSYIYIPFFKAKGYTVGSQDISDESPGAHTGEICGEVFKDMGVKYTLIGHFEIRKKSNEKIFEKIKRAKDNGIKVILCVGEEFGDALEKVDEELLGIDIDDVIVSYEPVWSIGSNLIPSNDEIDKIARHIKAKGFKKVLYGGSVNEGNIDELNNIPSLDGFLIGSACLKPDSIIKMIEVVSK